MSATVNVTRARRGEASISVLATQPLTPIEAWQLARDLTKAADWASELEELREEEQ